MLHMFQYLSLNDTFFSFSQPNIERYRTNLLQAPSSIQNQIGPRLNDLSPKLRSAAEFVLAYPDEVATRTLRQVAKAADLTPPTFSRLARALDCDTYDDLREICRSELKRRNRVLADKAQKLLQMSTPTGSTDQTGMFFVQARSAIDNIQNLLQSLELDRLRSAADAMARARKVVMFGTTSGEVMVNYFRCMAGMAFDNWIIAGADSAMWATELTKLGPKDVVFVVSIEPYSDRPVRAAQFARTKGARVIAITDDVEAPMATIATNCFFVKTQSPQFFPSHIVPLLVIEGLMGMVVRRAGAQAARNIQAVESAGHELKEYWID